MEELLERYFGKLFILDLYDDFENLLEETNDMDEEDNGISMDEDIEEELDDYDPGWYTY